MACVRGSTSSSERFMEGKGWVGGGEKFIIKDEIFYL